MSADTNPARELDALITQSAPNASAIRSFLDGLPEAERIVATRSLGLRVQQKLWHLVQGFGELVLEDFVAKSTPVLKPVTHYGRNSLPAFQLFEKRFYRYGDGSQMGGANFQTISAFTGPGYYIVSEDKNTREVLVDYRSVPTEKPEGWPKIVGNEGIPSRFIYGFMIDRMRRVSEHVTIGRANRHGKDLGNWFMLCRKEQP